MEYLGKSKGKKMVYTGASTLDSKVLESMVKEFSQGFLYKKRDGCEELYKSTSSDLECNEYVERLRRN